MNSVKALQRMLITSRHISKSLSFNQMRIQNFSIASLMCAQPKQVSEEEDVLFERIGGAGIITLNRPKALNALNLSMVRKIYPQIAEWEQDPKTTMIIMKAAGQKAFCAGGDIKSITDAAKAGDFSAGETFFREEYQLNYRIATCDVPFIALIDGITMGGGVGLSVHGENRICTERTLFAMPETGIGLFPDVGGSYFLPRLSLHLGMYLALTGFRLKGRDVYKAGVATRMVDSEILPQVEKELIAMANPTHQDITDLLRRHHVECETGRDRDYLILRDREEDIKKCFIADSVEQIFENLEKDGSEWALEQLTKLKKMSPTSLKVTHRQLTEGSSLPLNECLEMELRISANMLRGHDFGEGVRAQIVDKDRNPKWQPSTLEEVTDEMLDSYFTMVEGVDELDLSEADA